MTDSRGWGEALEVLGDTQAPTPMPKFSTETYPPYTELRILDDRPEFAVVVINVPYPDVEARGLPIRDFFRNTVCEIGIAYNRFKEVSLVCAIGDLTLATGSINNPSKMDPSRKERAWRQVSLEMVAPQKKK